MQEVCATSIWFNEEDCLELTKYEKYIFFVFGSFSGQAFEKIIALGNRLTLGFEHIYLKLVHMTQVSGFLL